MHCCRWKYCCYEAKTKSLCLGFSVSKAQLDFADQFACSLRSRLPQLGYGKAQSTSADGMKKLIRKRFVNVEVGSCVAEQGWFDITIEYFHFFYKTSAPHVA